MFKSPSSRFRQAARRLTNWYEDARWHVADYRENEWPYRKRELAKRKQRLLKTKPVFYSIVACKVAVIVIPEAINYMRQAASTQLSRRWKSARQRIRPEPRTNNRQQTLSAD